MSKKLTVAALVALACAPILPDARMIAATLPCEPDLRETAPAAPSGLRILKPGEPLPPAVAATAAPIGGETAVLAGVGAHAYFEALAARSECMVAYSLRDAAQVLQYTQQKYQPKDVTYDPARDPDPRRQDAAKILIPAGKVSLPNQVRLPIPPVGSDSLLVTWDVWWGKEFGFDQTGLGNYKAFQLASPADRIWTEIKSDFNWAMRYPSSVAVVHVRAYGEVAHGELGPSVTSEQPLSPMADVFAVRPETWTRYWVYFKPAGEFHEFSLWVADEGRDPVLINDRLPMKPNYAGGANGWEKFWIEYNTSGKGVEELGPRVSYVRNVVMLRGVNDPSRLFARPVR